MQNARRDIPSGSAKIQEFIVKARGEMTLKLHQRIRSQLGKAQFIKFGERVLSRDHHAQQLRKRRRHPKTSFLKGVAKNANIYLASS
ncbi:hypothetical protein AS156_16040 [Bradyrhizobium macuxiense]|uniref:Uncharacterized protein n=1 Tax=Bradyrhizobium macuxiense TaxID=1755647 RepID=A0A109JIM3_9BRAD|nr:hypothetical protein [Bradyrhizobium macuxiense]KWV49480.1 hypothetical protein AS156_16040 [Bradyrhizobium macuxiense]